jgi:hypothetical protein
VYGAALWHISEIRRLSPRDSGCISDPGCISEGLWVYLRTSDGSRKVSNCISGLGCVSERRCIAKEHVRSVHKEGVGQRLREGGREGGGREERREDERNVQ